MESGGEENKTKHGERIEPEPPAFSTDYDTTRPAPVPQVHQCLTIKLNGYARSPA